MCPDHTTDTETDNDVVVVGGGPAGCAAGVFTARYGLDTVVFDRGRSSLRRCAFLENYPGFPAGIDIETLYDLFHDHAEEAGCSVVADLVESVTRIEDKADARFLVEPQEGDPISARRIVAATRYGGEYLSALDGDAMFETHEHGGEVHEHFDRSYADSDGSTPIDGLYVASPATEADRQAIIAAGRGARVGLSVVEAHRREQGYFDGIADHYDWLRLESELEEEWRDRDRWREWADEHRPDDGIDDDRWETLREREIDRRLATYLEADEIDRRSERGQRRLLDHVDDDLIVERAHELESRPEARADGE